MKKDGVELLDFYKKLLIDLGGKGSGRVQAIYANASTSFRQPQRQPGPAGGSARARPAIRLPPWPCGPREPPLLQDRPMALGAFEDAAQLRGRHDEPERGAQLLLE